MIVDTHCHLFFEQYDEDREDVFERARTQGVGVFINVGIDEATNRTAMALAEKEPDAYATVGFHPHSAHLADESTTDRLKEQIQSSPKVVAVGEVGLDYFKSEADAEIQKRLFEKMITLAGEMHLPLVVHSREAFRDTIRILQEGKKKFPGLKAVFHCYTYGEEELTEVVESGFWVSFTGIVTFKGTDALRKAVAVCPPDRFMVETDAPYLAPQPKRGQRNEPAYLNFVLEEIARIRNEDPLAIESVTTRNALQFFNIQTPSVPAAKKQ